MAIAKDTKMSNRYGLNLKFHDLAAANTDGDITVQFANEVSLELTSDINWATGGQSHSNMIGFPTPITGTLTMSTQVSTIELLAIAAGVAVPAADSNAFTVSFKNAANGTIPAPKYYKITGNTLWVDETGKTYTETIIAYKALVKPGYSVTYNGDGDPQSVTVEFELSDSAEEESKGKVVDITRV